MRPPWRPVVALALGLALMAGCAPPSDRPAAPPAALYVAHSGAGTVAQLDGVTGRPLGPPLPAGESPWQLARGPDGSLLALSVSLVAAWPLTHVTRVGDGWEARPVALPGPAHEARLAGDGGRYAVVVHREPASGPGVAPPRCRLTFVDVPAATAAATAAVCGPHDLVTGLALDDGPAGPLAYLAIRGLWPDTPPDPADAGGGGRVVAVNAQTGATISTLRLDGVPVLVALGTAPGRLGRRLYAVERLADPEDVSPGLPHARLLGLNPTTLEIESERPLDGVPTRLVVAPDGEVAYALHDQSLTRLGLAVGPDRSVALPGLGHALAVAGDRVYVSGAFRPELWAFGRRDGRLLTTLPVGSFAADLLVSHAE